MNFFFRFNIFARSFMNISSRLETLSEQYTWLRCFGLNATANYVDTSILFNVYRVSFNIVFSRSLPFQSQLWELRIIFSEVPTGSWNHSFNFVPFNIFHGESMVSSIKKWLEKLKWLFCLWLCNTVTNNGVSVLF